MPDAVHVWLHRVPRVGDLLYRLLLGLPVLDIRPSSWLLMVLRVWIVSSEILALGMGVS